jgi:hypothetical protein
VLYEVFWLIYTNIIMLSCIYADSGKNYQEKCFIMLSVAVNVIKLLGAIYGVVSITSVKISIRYADSGKNY